MRTVNITDYELKSKTLAKVIISYTGNVDAEYITDELTKKLEFSATVVPHSFKQIKAGVAVGFIKANKAVRVVSEKEVKAGYRVMSSNVLMSEADKTLWDVKDSPAGKYLTRHGQEDLTALVQAAAQRRTDIPRVKDITIAKASTKELVAFVDEEGDMDYGFATATSDSKVRVLSFKRRVPITAEYGNVVSIYPVDIPKSMSDQVIAAMTDQEKKDANAYWKKLFFYAPDYLRQIQQYVNQGTVA